MTCKRAILWFCVSALSACAPADKAAPAKVADASAVSPPPVAPRAVDWETAFGIAVSRPDTLCLKTRRADIPNGTRVVLVATDTIHVSTTATVAGRIASNCGVEAGDTIEHVYRMTAANAETGVLWIALIDSANAYQPGRPIDIDADGTPEQFRDCTSHEGIHFSVWTGAPLTGIMRWHYYYYLAYDVDPTCVDKDFPK